MYDGGGAVGAAFSYALIVFFVGVAFVVFVYLWNLGKLDMDEDPKWQMLKQEDEHE